jgi:hypothetical protein
VDRGYDHPDVVRRLVLASTGCRLSAKGRRIQARVAVAWCIGTSRTPNAYARTPYPPTTETPRTIATNQREGAKGESAPVTRYTFFIYQVSPG